MTENEENYQRSRSAILRLISVLFVFPEEETKGIIENLTDQLKDFEDDSLVELSSEIKKVFNSTALQTLQVEYTKLFIGPGKEVVYPYGSVYLEDKKMVSCESTYWLEKRYSKWGVSIEVKEPADHIALVLEFMFILSKDESDGSLLEQSILYNDYVLKWVPGFCDLVVKQNYSDFYVPIAKLVKIILTNIYSDKYALKIGATV